MKIIFLGTPDFAADVLEILLHSEHRVVAVVTQPNRAKDRKGNLLDTPAKLKAMEYGIPVYQFEKIKSVENIEILKQIKPDIIVTAAYGQILSADVLNLAPHGVINVHASVLPKYRGSSPVQSALLCGDRETGVTIMQTEEGLDTGDILACEKLVISDDDNAEILLKKLALIGGQLLVKTLGRIENGEVVPVKQNDEDSTKCRLLVKKDGLIDWNLPNYVTHNQIRALISWPTAYTYFHGKILKIFGSVMASECGNPGTVLKADDDGIKVACGQGSLLIKTLQLEGKKKLDVADFLRGIKLQVGDFFG